MKSSSAPSLLDLSSTHPDANVVVVSHGDVIRAMLMYVLGTPIDRLHHLEVLPASISVVTIDPWASVVRQMNGDSVRGAD